MVTSIVYRSWDRINLGLLKNTNHSLFSKHPLFIEKPPFFALFLYFFHLFRMVLIEIKKGVPEDTPLHSQRIATTLTVLPPSTRGVDHG